MPPAFQSGQHDHPDGEASVKAEEMSPAAKSDRARTRLRTLATINFADTT